MRMLALAFFVFVSSFASAGYVVNGWCHSTATLANEHVVSQLHMHQDSFIADSSGSFNGQGAMYVFTVNGSGQLVKQYRKVESNGSVTNYWTQLFQLPSCDSALHDQLMPWGSAGGGSALQDEALQAGMDFFGEPIGEAHMLFVFLASSFVQCFLLGSIRGRQR